MRFSLNRISIVSFCLFVISISLDPTGTIFRVKESMFVFCFFISFFYQETKKAISRDIQLILWFCLLLPIWGIMVSLIRNNLEDISYAFGHFKSFLFIFIFFFQPFIVTFKMSYFFSTYFYFINIFSCSLTSNFSNIVIMNINS